MIASRLRIPLLSSTWTVIISGCMVGPNYRVPESAVINASAARQDFVSSADPALSGAAVPELFQASFLVLGSL